MYFEKSMSEHRTPEVKSIISELEKRIKEEERKAYVDPEKAEEAKEKGNDFFNKGKYLFLLIYFCYYCTMNWVNFMAEWLENICLVT